MGVDVALFLKNSSKAETQDDCLVSVAISLFERTACFFSSASPLSNSSSFFFPLFFPLFPNHFHTRASCHGGCWVASTALSCATLRCTMQACLSVHRRYCLSFLICSWFCCLLFCLLFNKFTLATFHLFKYRSTFTTCEADRPLVVQVSRF